MLSTASKKANGFSRDNLHDYQHKAVEFIKNTPSCALWVDLGLGKTVTTLTAIADLLDTFEVGRVLVISPLQVALHTWPAEITRWQHTRHLTFDVLAGKAKTARWITLRKSETDVHIINREMVPWLVNVWGNDWPYDMVVIDEASSFKSSKSQRFKALKKVLPKIDRMVQLTGTPASNGLLDLYSQVFLLDKGERLGRTYSSFRDCYFTSDYMGYHWQLREGAEEKIYHQLTDICLTLSAKDYLELPEQLDNIIPVAIPAKARHQYRELEREFLLELEQGTVIAFNAAALTNKLLQFCNGAVYTDDQGNWTTVHDGKLDALEEIIEASAGQPVLVAYHYQSDLERIKKRFPKAEQINLNSSVEIKADVGKPINIGLLEKNDHFVYSPIG